MQFLPVNLAMALPRKVLEQLEKLSEGSLGTALRNACNAFDNKAISADTGGPRLSVRALARFSSDPDGHEASRLDRAKKERNEIWAKAQAVRREHWKIELWKPASKSQEFKSQILQYRSASKVSVELHEKHRACILSADLLGEAPTPWTCAAFDKTHESRLEMLVQAVAGMDSECSFAFAFDGRVRENRKIIEDAFAKASVSSTELAELWFSYEKAAGF